MNITIELTERERKLIEGALCDYASDKSTFIKNETLELLANIGKQAANQPEISPEPTDAERDLFEQRQLWFMGEHSRVADDKDIDILNHGWVVSENGIASKTTAGILSSEIKDGKLIHSVGDLKIEEQTLNPRLWPKK